MQGIELVNSEIGVVSSRVDGSVKFTVITSELLASQRGLCMEYHGKACSVTIKPHGEAAPEMVKVDTERTSKTPSQRLRSVLFLVWKQTKQDGTFDEFYNRQYEVVIETYKSQLP